MKSVKRISQVFFMMFALVLVGGQVEAAETAKPKKNVRYKSGQSVDFEKLLIQGELKRPDIAVVTGDASQGSDGLLRLREDFLDRMASDIGESAK